jgi:Uma2 family endonuclease
MTATEPRAKKRVTMDELSSYGSAWVEIANGEVVTIDMSAATFLHAVTIKNICEMLDRFARANKLGHVFGDGLTYILSRDSQGIETARIPDVSFIRQGRLPKGQDVNGPVPFPPDLAVEVMSPDDRVKDIMLKIGEYLDAGTEQVWVFFPDQKQVHQYRRDDRKTVRVYRGSDVMDAEALFPGLKLVTQELFKLPELE